ncbi:MAG: hypothetical protein R3F38_11500 [Gammaproteobacteria bacterium]
MHAVLKDDKDPRRKEVLERFIDREGILFLSGSGPSTGQARGMSSWKCSCRASS